MAASDQHPRPRPAPPGQTRCAVPHRRSDDRLEEEINRAGRHGTQLSCLLVVIENLEELAREQGRRSPRADVHLVGGRCDGSCAATTGSGGRASEELLLCSRAPTAPVGRSSPGGCSSGCARSRSKPTACAGRCAFRWGSRPGVRTSSGEDLLARPARPPAGASRRSARVPRRGGLRGVHAPGRAPAPGRRARASHPPAS